MFATLLGALPRPLIERSKGLASDDELVAAAIRAQEAAGLEPITDGRLRGHAINGGQVVDGLPDLTATIAAWRFAAAETDRAVKQALPGPYSIGRREAGAEPPRTRAAAARAATERAADALRAIVIELAAAGCPLVEIEETDAHLVGDDASERELFRAAHRRLLDGVSGTHLSLSIVGGSAWGAGLETILAAPYASLAVDLIAGPDNWNLVTRTPGERGVIAGTLPGFDSPAEAREMLVWAARHAAASRARGLDRVGLGSAGSWANLTWEGAVEKMQRLGEAARIAAMPAGPGLAAELDPRAVNARTAALGHAVGTLGSNPPVEEG